MTQQNPGGSKPVGIGTAAARSGVSARMVRHYEGLGLLRAVARSESGYRQYSPADVHSLRFIKRARDLGFSMEEIAELMGLWHNRRRSSASVKRIAQHHLEDLEIRIAGLQAMRQTLAHLVHGCHGDARPDCPILDELSGKASMAAAGTSPGPRCEALDNSVGKSAVRQKDAHK